MQTRSPSKLSRDQTSNPTSSTNPTPKGRIRRSSKQKVENSNFEEHLPPVATMADNHTMAEMLRAPTEGCVEAIVVPLILAEQFELNHILINMMTSEQFFGLEKDNPHDHIWAARRWLEKEPPHSITTWDDLVSKFINEFFPPSRTTNLRNEILIFHQKFDESFHEAWERYEDLLRACPHHGFTELWQFVRKKSPRCVNDHRTQIQGSQFPSKPIASPVNACDINSSSKIAKHTHAVNQQTSVVTTAMTAMLKQLQATPPPAPVKAVEEICVTCGGAHLYYQCLATGGNTFPEFRDNIQGSGSLPSNTVANPKGELKAITTRSGLVTDGHTIPTPPKSITPEVGECVKETYTDPDLVKDSPLLNIPYLSRMLKQKQQEKDKVQIQKFWHMFKQLHLNITLTEALVLMPKYQKMLKALLSNKEKLQELANTPMNENCSAVILKKLPKKLGDPEKFPIPCGFSELKCKALADLGASINLMPLSVWKELSLPNLIPTRMTLELANRVICTPDRIARDVFVPFGKFTFPADFVIVDYESDPRTSSNPTFSLHKEITSPEVTHEIHDLEGCNVLSEELPDIDSFNDIHPHFDDNPLSGSTTYSSKSLLEEFTDELALIAYPPDYDDNLLFDINSDLREIEFLLYQVESDADNVYDDPFDSKGNYLIRPS
nr:reverse transcriptase domain-containing protein [Tanacetum cinerariifolium]